MDFYLGVDGGGTKTEYAIVNEQGEIIAYDIKGSCDYLNVGFEGIKSNLEETIANLCKKANIGINDIKFSCFGIPNYGENLKDSAIINNIIRGIVKENFICINDVEAAYEGSLAGEPGIHIVAGTGSIVFGKDSSGNTARSGGWGDFLGDEGSAYWLAKKMLELFTKQSDGRIQKSLLYSLIKQHFCISRDLDLVDIVYKQLKTKRDKIADLQIILCKAAQNGDCYAIKAYEDAAYELFIAVKAVINNLDLGNTEGSIKVSYSGGVFKCGRYIIHPLRKYLLSSNAVLCEPLLKPVLGSVLVAIKSSNKELDFSKLPGKLARASSGL